MATTATAPEDRLAGYLKKVERDERKNTDTTEGARRVEAIIAELELPVVKEEAAMWRIDADVGEVRVGLSDDGSLLSIWQVLFELKDLGKHKKHAELYHDLLVVNR